MSVTVGACIATHNRRVELARSLAVLVHLDPLPDEILVCADGCTDGTAEWLRAEFPKVKLIVNDVARGSVPSRNALAAACGSDVMLSLDDDSHPIEHDFIARVRAIFEKNPRLAVASFPQRTDETPITLAREDFGPAQFVGSYANSAAAIRRTVFEKLGGYVAEFGHMYEEPDFALRCVCAGWQVRFEPGATVRHHYTSSARSEVRNHQRHARNEFWSIAMRCPLPQAFAIALFRAARQLGYAWRRGWTLREGAWWLAAMRGLGACLRARSPLPWARYLAWMRLVRTPIADAREWERFFGEAQP